MGQRSKSMDRDTLMALVEASRTIIGELDLADVFTRVAETAASVMGAEGASVLLYDEERSQLVFQTAVGPGSESLVGERFDAALGIAGQVVKTRRAVVVDDVRQNRHFFPGIDAKTQVRTRSLMAAPLLHQDTVLGVVEVLNPTDRERFTQRDLELLEVFANMAAAASANAQAYDKIAKQNRGLRASVSETEVVGRSSAINRVMELCRKVALSNATVLLYGDTGTGKELAARTIHRCSPRAERPFIAINCAALPETLLESELFGHEKGAFTGATARKLGRFELADGGTLFLDEIGEISAALQVKLLRVLQEREFVRVGGTQTVTCDVRIIAATNRNLKREMEQGRFRDDLYYRLNVFPITLPPLRDRIEDLPALIEHFARQVCPSLGIAAPTLDDAALAALMRYGWPGNVRELRNVVERCTLLASEGRVTVGMLPGEIIGRGGGADGSASSSGAGGRSSGDGRAASGDDGESGGARSRIADHERLLIARALDEARWNQSKAARSLGISRDNLRYRMRKFGLKPPEDGG